MDGHGWDGIHVRWWATYISMPNVPVPCLAKQSGEHKEKQRKKKEFGSRWSVPGLVGQPGAPYACVCVCVCAWGWMRWDGLVCLCIFSFSSLPSSTVRCSVLGCVVQRLFESNSVASRVCLSLSLVFACWCSLVDKVAHKPSIQIDQQQERRRKKKQMERRKKQMRWTIVPLSPCFWRVEKEKKSKQESEAQNLLMQTRNGRKATNVNNSWTANKKNIFRMHYTTVDGCKMGWHGISCWESQQFCGPAM